METKRCPKCGETKLIDAFGAHRSRKDGLASNCKECTAEYKQKHADRIRETERAYMTRNRDKARAKSRGWYRKNASQKSVKSRQWRDENHPRVTEYNAVRRARSAHCDPTIQPVDRAAIVARDNGTCYLCGGKPDVKLLELDHVVPLSRGGAHTPENLRVSCHSCNARKRDKLLSELDWYIPQGQQDIL